MAEKLDKQLSRKRYFINLTLRAHEFLITKNKSSLLLAF